MNEIFFQTYVEFFPPPSAVFNHHEPTLFLDTFQPFPLYHIFLLVSICCRFNLWFQRPIVFKID